MLRQLRVSTAKAPTLTPLLLSGEGLNSWRSEGDHPFQPGIKSSFSFFFKRLLQVWQHWDVRILQSSPRLEHCHDFFGSGVTCECVGSMN